MDLRWQRADQPVGFYGLKKGVTMRTSDNDKPDIEWDSFDNVDRSAEQHKAVEKKVGCQKINKLCISGKWQNQNERK